MNSTDYNRELSNYLAEFVTDNRKARIEEVLSFRTRKLTVVLEDIYKPHNASAVLRTSECFGLQDVHVVEQNHRYTVNPYVTRGAAQWLTLHRYDAPSDLNIARCFKDLRQNGYQILGTSVAPSSIPVEELSVNDKTAIVFGTEYDGISTFVHENADEFVHIPMLGFTESYNISVSAAIIFQSIMPLIRQSDDWHLTELEKSDIRLEWYKLIVKNSDIHIKRFNEQMNLNP